MPPPLWILAGPNGSGKSTFAQHDIFSRLSGTPEAPADLVRINPDSIAARLQRARPSDDADALSRAAAEQSDAEIDRHIEAGDPLLIETVLSTDKFLSRVDRALEQGYWICLVFVLLRAPELNVERVAARVAVGGHNVPEERIRARWVRSLERLPVFARRVSAWSVWDNSGWAAPPILLAERIGAPVHVTSEYRAVLADPATHPALRRALQAIAET